MAKAYRHFCQVGMGASVTKPMGLEVANNSCLVGTEHHVGDSTSEQARVTRNPCSKEPCKGMSCTHSCYFTGVHQRGPSVDLSKNRKVVHVTADSACLPCLLLARQKLVKAELGAPDILFLLLLPESCSRGGLHCVIITWFAK